MPINPPLMACGHTANAHDEQGNPVCVICTGIHPGADQVAEKPDLTGRMAECLGCRHTPPTQTQSSWNLPFFRYQPGQQTDSYDCGCYGWD